MPNGQGVPPIRQSRSPTASDTPSQPGDPFGSWRDEYGSLRAQDGTTISDTKESVLARQSRAGELFAGVGERGYGALTAESQGVRDRLRQLAEGRDSLAAEQLRQGLQQNLAAQRSMAAGASPQSSAMAARTAAMNMGRLGAGMSGQAATAGIQERNAATNALMSAITQQRGQDLQAALASRQNAISPYRDVEKEKSDVEKYGPAIASGVGTAIAAFSDRRLKKDIKNADREASNIAERLKAYSFRYSDKKYGEGEQFGVMAQDLEKSGLKHAVIDTPEGKMVHGGKLAAANTAMIGSLSRRISELEGGRK